MPDRHPCETCGTPTWLERRWCGPGCEQIAAMAAARTACKVCGSLHPNPECETCVGAQLAREVARLLELKELEED